MTVALVCRELLLATRIGDAAARAGVPLVRVDEPGSLPQPETLDLVLVDWDGRSPMWGAELAHWRAGSDRPRLILFGPHTDLAAHEDARRSGLGPMMARGRLLARLPSLLGEAPSTASGSFG